MIDREARYESDIQSKQPRSHSWEAAGSDRRAQTNTDDTMGEHEVERLTYWIKWLRGTRVRTYYGCGGCFRDLPEVPLPPYDIVLVCKEYRLYPVSGGSLRMSMKKENTHYHLSTACILQRNVNYRPQDVQITEYDRQHFLPSHRELLRSSLGLDVLFDKV